MIGPSQPDLQSTRWPEARWHPWVLPLAIGLLVYQAASFSQAMRNFAYDDAYISFRYARNWVEGYGLVFNVGERVEGYSNFLWVALNALGMGAGADPVVLSQALGIVSAILLLVVVWVGGARLLALPPTARALAVAWLAGSNSLAAAAVSGLETTFFALLVGLGLMLGVSRKPAFLALSGVATLLGCLTRMEGTLLVAWLPVWWLLQGRAWRHIAGWLAAVLLPFAVYFCWRWSYFGDFLPNTFHAKVGLSEHQIWRGMRYAGDFSLSHLLPVFGVVLPFLRRGPRAPAALAVGGFALLFSAYVIGVGGDWPYAHRFFVPVLAPIAMIGAVGWAGASERWSQSGRRNRPWLSFLLVVALGLTTWVASSRMGERARLVPFERPKNVTRLALARWLRSLRMPGATIALGDVGIIPYYSGMPTLDMYGLTDRHIAHLDIPLGQRTAGHEKTDLDYVLARRPDFVLRYEKNLLAHPVVAAEYRPDTIPRIGRTILVLRDVLPRLERGM